jgi:hypothetical protein
MNILKKWNPKWNPKNETSYNPSELSPAGMNDHWLLEKITIVQQGESSK